jgi:integrase
MAHVEDRWFNKDKDTGTNVPTERHGKGNRWRVRYLVDGRERSLSFVKKDSAEKFLTNTAADLLRGTYRDPDAGRVTLRKYGKTWLEAQTFDESTREQTEMRLRVHVYPVLGDMHLASIKPTTVSSWMRGLQTTLAPRTVRVILANLSSLLTAAVDDELIVKNPCQAASVRAPKVDVKRVTPWTAEQVEAVTKGLPERFRVAAVVGAGLGLRQGEIFGLAVEDIDFLRGVVTVRRQVKILHSRQVFALPKGRKVRTVPLPESVKLALAAHLEAWPAASVELPWEAAGGKATAANLILSTRERTACQRSYFNLKVWKPALVSASMLTERTEANGMHALRHFYASVLLDAGESVRALAEYLGHSDPGFTLRVYTHLMPSSEERTRRAVDAAFGYVAPAAVAG